MKIVTAIYSFKGSLTSLEVSNTIEKGVQKVFSEAEVVKNERGIDIAQTAGAVAAGDIADDTGILHEHGIDSFFSIVNHPLSLKEAMEPKKTAFFIESSTEEVFRLIKICKDEFSK